MFLAPANDCQTYGAFVLLGAYLRKHQANRGKAGALRGLVKS
jgi:hypothetical protein